MAEEKKEKGLRAIISSTGGRRFIIAILAFMLATLCVSNAWISSASYENIIIYIGAIFITGNTLEHFKPVTDGLLDKFTSKKETPDKAE